MTKQYRLRRGLFGKAILQYLCDTPSIIGGHVDATIRDVYWTDVDFKHAPVELVEVGK